MANGQAERADARFFLFFQLLDHKIELTRKARPKHRPRLSLARSREAHRAL